MSVLKPVAALAASSLMFLGAVAMAQSGDGGGGGAETVAGVQPLVLNELLYVNWIEKSSVAALREGVIERMELQIGMPVKKDGKIGQLHREFARLSIEKARLQADSVGPTEKAIAQREVAESRVARDQRLNHLKPNFVSAEDVAKDEGEFKVAVAMIKEARENQAIAKAELALAERTFKEYEITAPYDGIIIKRMKNPGESVRAGDAVVDIGNLDHLAVDAYVPLEYAYRVKEDQIVEIQPRLGVAGAAPLPIEKKRFRGKIKFVDPEIQPVAENAVRIRAEFDNPPPYDLRPGLQVRMTIYLSSETAGAGPTASGTHAARAR